MPVIISADQLVGRFQVSQNTKNITKIEEYIDSIEKPTIIKILGATLGNEFWDDLDSDGVPTEQRFLDLYEAFDLDDGNEIRSSVGITEILLAFVYAAYLRDSDQMNTDVGNQNASGENSVRVNPSSKIIKAYNNAVESIHNIQWFIEENIEEYEGYNGQRIGFMMF